MCFFICFIFDLSLLIVSFLLYVFALIFVKLAFRIIVLHSNYIASFGKFTSCLMSNDPKIFIIPILISKHLELNRTRVKDYPRQRARPSGRTRRTVHRCRVDYLRGSQGRGEVLDVLELISDHLRASRTIRTCRA
jgi:hypothetical protein